VYALTNYILLGRTLYYVPYLSIIRPERVISTFVGLDGLVETLAGNGAAKIANASGTPAQMKVGNVLVRASRLLQVVFFLAFMSLEVHLHVRLVKAGMLNARLRMIVSLLYTSSTLILIQNIYRCISIWQGLTGYLLDHEAFFYVFDTRLMLANSVMLNIWYPAR
jgi:hypothetical protein